MFKVKITKIFKNCLTLSVENGNIVTKELTYQHNKRKSFVNSGFNFIFHAESINLSTILLISSQNHIFILMINHGSQISNINETITGLGTQNNNQWNNSITLTDWGT